MAWITIMSLHLTPRRQARILVVDDETTIAELLAELLEDEGYEVQRAYDGRQALALLDSAAPPDLVISDVMMPRLSGLELVATIRQRASRSCLPFLLLSAGAQPDIRWDHVAFLPKPVRLEQILREVTRALAEAAATRPQRDESFQESA